MLNTTIILTYTLSLVIPSAVLSTAPPPSLPVTRTHSRDSLAFLSQNGVNRISHFADSQLNKSVRASVSAKPHSKVNDG